MPKNRSDFNLSAGMSMAWTPCRNFSFSSAVAWTRNDSNAAANSGGPDIISFAISGSGVHTISPLSQLPNITDPLIVDGYTQAGSSPNSNGPGLGDNAVLQIELDGSLAGSGASGLYVTSGASTVRGLVVNRFDAHPNELAHRVASEAILKKLLQGVSA